MLNSFNSDYSHEHLLRSFTFNPQLPLRLIPPVTCVLPHEPSFTLTSSTSYLCTPRGVVGSLRPAGTGELFIGRQGMDECGQFVNDIVLGSEDAQASRRHVCIAYGRYLVGRREIMKEMVAFLMGKQHRLGVKSAIKMLPNVLIGEIFAYLYPRKALYLTDCGTLSGTYIRARDFLPLEPGSLVLTSPVSGFEVVSTNWAYFNPAAVLLHCNVHSSSPVLWVLLLSGDPTAPMLVKRVVGLTETTRLAVEREAGAEVRYRAGRWWVKETEREGFGSWLCTSLARQPGEVRFMPRWVEITKGCEIRASSTVISLL